MTNYISPDSLYEKVYIDDNTHKIMMDTGVVYRINSMTDHRLDGMEMVGNRCQLTNFNVGVPLPRTFKYSIIF